MLKDYNMSAICMLTSRQLSPLKKVKCKIGYGSSLSLDSGGDSGEEGDKTPSKGMKHLCLLDNNKTDIKMRGVGNN